MFEFDDLSEIRNAEFDWFGDEPEAIYNDIDESMDMPENDMEKTDYTTVYETEEIPDIKYTEDVEAAMNEVFSYVYEQLCGFENEEFPRMLSDCIEELNKYCEVIQTDMDNCSASEIMARIEQCFSDKGCIVAIVDNSLWSEDNDEEAVFADSGMRAVCITEMDNGRLTIIDPSEPGLVSYVSVKDLSEAGGILLEVLK